jgi:hypothetical protein
MIAYSGVRSLMFVAGAAFLAACGAGSPTPDSLPASYPSDGALALTGASRALLTASQQRIPPKIDARAWSAFTIYSSQVNLLDEGRATGLAVNSGSYYRLNTRDPDNDYFLLEMVGLEQVREFNGCPFDARRASRYCEYLNGGFTMETSLMVNGAPVGSVVDDSPRGRIDHRYYAVSVGASLANEVSCEAGWTGGLMVAAPAVAPCTKPLSAVATYNYYPETVTGENLTQLGASTVQWRAEFVGMDHPHCKGNFPSNSTSEGNIGAFAIVRVPRGALYGANASPTLTISDKNDAFNRSYRVAAGSCAGLTTFNHRDRNAHAREDLLPEFKVAAAAHGLRVHADGTATLAIDSHTVYDFRGLAPSLEFLNNGAIVDPKSVGITFSPDAATAYALQPKSSGTFPAHGTWTISAHNAIKGTYTVLVDSAPGGQADRLRNGPIAVTLTVE